MNPGILILIVEALAVYGLVLWAHALRRRYGTVHFHVLIGALTAIMSWVTDAGLAVEAMGITFMVGSTVFYTALLLAVFVIYVFDGPRETRILITTIVGISALMPLIAAVLHWQGGFVNSLALQGLPRPSLRVNTASVAATVLDLVFLAIVWESLGRPVLRMRLWGRTYLTLLGVMWLDVLLFATGAFFGTPAYLGIMQGTLLARLLVSLLAFPLLYAYMQIQSHLPEVSIENRPVLSILRRMEKIADELTAAQREIERRKLAEAALQKALSEVKTLRGMIPICAGCKSIRDDKGYWQRIESYLNEHAEVQLSHGLCPDCIKKYYPDYAGKPATRSDADA